MMPLKVLLYPIFISLFAFSHDWEMDSRRPSMDISESEKMFECESGKGFTYESATLMSPAGDEKITALVFVQSYGNKWEKRAYSSVGSGLLPLALQSCDYTGNHYTFAYYTEHKPSFVPEIPDVLERHEKRGAKPLFKVTKKYESHRCKGVIFDEGIVFAPNGEEVKVTLFMEKRDGHWRKKDFLFVGSGKVLLDIEGCDLTGKHKKSIVINKNL